MVVSRMLRRRESCDSTLFGAVGGLFGSPPTAFPGTRLTRNGSSTIANTPRASPASASLSDRGNADNPDRGGDAVGPGGASASEDVGAGSIVSALEFVPR